LTDHSTIRIVGIGASAGGLAALEQFLSHAPADAGLAYVVVQHLAPSGKAMLSELLQRVSAMSVHEAQHDELIKPDNVYVIPPNTEIRVVKDRLKLARPSEPRGLRLPVNVLFSSLASARGENTIAVVLSGMGSDGTLGLQAVKAVGGLTVVQSPETAEFDSMPKSAIAAGCADIQDTAGALPGRILDFINKLGGPAPAASTPAKSKPAESTSEADSLQSIIRLLQKQTRHDFSLYRSSTLQRRVDRRLAIHGLESVADYAGYLEHNPLEVELLFNEILIGVTGFFRDPEVWEHLIEVTLPDLLARETKPSDVRVWCVGCSTGEEAYSLVMALTEAMNDQTRPFKLQVFASLSMQSRLPKLSDPGKKNSTENATHSHQSCA